MSPEGLFFLMPVISSLSSVPGLISSFSSAPGFMSSLSSGPRFMSSPLSVPRFSALDTKNVDTPDPMITKTSTGARTSAPIPSKKKPCPNLYRFPERRIISPMYIMPVITAEIIAGTINERNGFLPSKNEPPNTPATMPISMKKTIMSAAERGETSSSPVL